MMMTVKEEVPTWQARVSFNKCDDEHRRDQHVQTDDDKSRKLVEA